jgi:hypothetical protein
MSRKAQVTVDTLNEEAEAERLSDTELDAINVEEEAKAEAKASRKRKPKSDGLRKDLKAMGLENFEMLKVHRRDLKGAPYNPRILDDNAKRKLKAGLERHGMVSPITWNARTGNIVGGHQRLSQLDSLAGSDDYEITVARIDVDDGREKEINILLNNSQAMGDWDMEALANLVKDPAIVLAGTGFDHSDLFQLFGDSPLIERNEKLDELADKVREARDRYNAIEANNTDMNTVDFYLVVVFRDTAQRTNFTEALKLPDNRYQSGEQFATMLGVFDQLSKGAA